MSEQLLYIYDDGKKEVQFSVYAPRDTKDSGVIGMPEEAMP